MHRRLTYLIGTICVTLGTSATIGSAQTPAPPAADPPASASPTDAPAPPPAAPTEAPSGPTGTVKGRAIDDVSKEGLAAATIQVLSGTTVVKEAIAELDGTFSVSLPPGGYTIVFSTPEYVEQRRTVTITEAQALALDVVLAPVPRTGSEEQIEVYGAIDSRKDSAVLAERRTAATVSDAISAQQIARSPDSNASDAAKRMVAATIQDNRYVVIRGLGGRYSTTLLNGVPLPSPDPDTPAAPLDLFPASLITNLTVNKTFSPDMPGNFAGGALGIETRSYPTQFQFRAKVSLAGNTRSSFRTLNSQFNGDLDMLGYDDGTRALPGAIPGDRLAGQGSAEETAAQAAGFKNHWLIDRSMAGPNLGLGATLGDTYKLSSHRLGYFASASYGHGHASRTIHIARPGEDDGNGGKLPSTLQLDDEQGIEQASVGAVGGLGWTPAPGHKLDLFTLYTHNTDISSSEITGIDASTARINRTRLQFLQRELMFTQLVGDNRLADRVILEWQGNVARTAQSEPDTRDLLQSVGEDGSQTINTSPGGSDRLFGELADTTLGGAAGVRIPLGTVVLKAGTAIQRSARAYQVRRFHFGLTGDGALLPPDEAFAAERAGAGMTMRETTLPGDGYTATRSVVAGYAMADVNITSALRAIGGVRYERSSLDVDDESKIMQGNQDLPVVSRDNNDVLPSLNAVYALTPSTNLRAAYTTTLARPNFREVAPAIYFDYVRQRSISGNDKLEDTRIHNGDLRLETFLGDSEVLAASVFAKRFTRPIERTVSSGGDGDTVGFRNADHATVYGGELEARLSLGRLTGALAAFSIGSNLSVMKSEIDIEGTTVTRPLQGQSAYVANIGLGYDNTRLGTRVDLAYNVFGERLEDIGTGGAGNVYEKPFHRMDLTISQALPRSLRLKVAGGNLLNQRVVRTQDDVEIYAYPIGVTVLGSVEYSLE